MSDLFPLAQCPLRPIMLSQIVQFHSFLSPSNIPLYIPLYICSISYLSNHLLMDTWVMCLIHSATLCLLMRSFKVIIDRYVVIEFISKEQWPPSGKKEDKDIRTPRSLPGLNLAQVCILFFSPSCRQLNFSGNRKTKENVFSEAHGNWAPQATEILKCFHSVLSGVLYQ